jgi:hypothetical protein
MPYLQYSRKIAARAATTAALLASCWVLAGCAGVGDGFASSVFVDPAKYELYDCTQLEAERKALEARTQQLQGYIDKAQTGAAGTVVGEAVYRNDYISTRASLKLANETWERGKCVASPVPMPPVPAAQPSDKHRRTKGR